MARPQKCRTISNPPKMKGFRPFGLPSCRIESVRLSFEEYESIKLVNYNLLTQEAAADKMKISRPTLTRIYNSAIRTVAKAFIEGKIIEIEGGNCQFDKEWYRCRKCFRLIEGMENHRKCENCTLFNEKELVRINPPLMNG
jgi:uncharacterized protein